MVKSIVANKSWASSKALKISVEHIEPLHVEFTPGQFISLKVSKDLYRAYSICSSCEDTRRFSLIIDAKHMGIGASYVRSLKIGDVIEFVGPSGRLELKKPLPENLYFYATGTGIAPFISMLYKLEKEAYKGNIFLYHGVRQKDEMLFIDTLKKFSNSLENLTYEIYISQDFIDPPYKTGRITHTIDTREHKENSNVYICGNPYMVTEVKNILLRKGFPEKNIFYEGFTYAVR